MKFFEKIDVTNYPKVIRLSMFLLAVYPVLESYVFMGSKFNYASIASVILLIYSLFSKKVSFRSLPTVYYVFWAYSAWQMIAIAGIQGWSDYFPGGVMLTIFSLGTVLFVGNLNFDCLYKYTRIVWIFSGILFLFQLIIFYVVKQKISVFLPIGEELTYCNYTYQELVSIHSTVQGGLIQRFSSIFCEPSYYGQYCSVFLLMELFRKKNINHLYTPLSILIVLNIILIQAGVGLLGLVIVAFVKLGYIIFVTRNTKYYFLLLLIIPISFVGFKMYLDSSSDSYIVSRTSELSMDETSTSSGAFRIYYGWLKYSELSPFEKMVGTSRNYALSFFENGFINGACYLFINMGWIGACVLLLSYIYPIRKRNALCVCSLLLFVTLMLVESIYLGGLMYILTAIIYGFQRKKY